MPRQQPSSPKKKRKQLDFEDWYEIAKKYYEEHGDLLVPRIYEDEEGHKLGRWIERLRAFYNGNPKIKVALTQTGMIIRRWKTSTATGMTQTMCNAGMSSRTRRSCSQRQLTI